MNKAPAELSAIPKKRGIANHGMKYELQITTLLTASLAQNKNVTDYWIISSPLHINHFDDIVAGVTDLRGNKYVFLVQSKHSHKVMRLLTSACKDEKDYIDIPLYKYLKSYNAISSFEQGQLKQKLNGIPLENYYYCIFTTAQGVEPQLKSVDILPDNPLTYLDVTKCGKYSRWVVKIPDKFLSFSKQLYFFMGQPNSSAISYVMSETLPGLTKSMIGNLCDLIDDSLTHSDYCVELTKALYSEKLSQVLICHQITANKIQNTEVIKQYFAIFDKIFTTFTVVKIKPEDEEHTVMWMYAYYEYKIQELYDNAFNWNECYENCFRLHRHTKVELKKMGLMSTHVVDLLLEMWQRGEIPFVVCNINQCLFTNQISILTTTNCRFVLIVNPQEELTIPRGTKLFETLYDLVEEDVIFQKIMNIQISLQGRPHVPLSDLTGRDTNILRNIASADLIKWVSSIKSARGIGRKIGILEEDYIERKFQTFNTIGNKSERVHSLQSEEQVINGMYNGLTVIVNDAGMGKSTVLASLALRYNPKNYVIHYNLSDCLEDLALDSGVIYKDPIEYFFNKWESNNYEPLAYQIYKLHRSTGRLTILIDSFDEILPVYHRKVVTIIKQILTENICVFITTRTQAQDLLIEKFKSFKHIHLQALENADIERYCQMHEVPITALKTLPVDFLSVPLHLNMFTLAYKNLGILNIRITSLYEEFIKRKIQDFCKKKKIEDQNTIQNLEIEEVVLKRHYKLALVYIFGKRTVEELKIIRGQEWNRIVQNFNEYKSALGLVSFVDSAAHIRFIHKTFAEYLVAKWICDHHKETVGRELYKKVVKENEYVEVYRLLDEITSALSGETYSTIMDKQHENNHLLLEHKDIWGRLPAHSAASRCHHSHSQPDITEKYKILDKFMTLTPKCIKLKDDILHWTAFDFLVGKQRSQFQRSTIDIKHLKVALESNCPEITGWLFSKYTLVNSEVDWTIIQIALDNNFAWVVLLLLGIKAPEASNLDNIDFSFSRSSRKLLMLLVNLDENIKQWIIKDKIIIEESRSNFILGTNNYLKEKIFYFTAKGDKNPKISTNGDNALNFACAFGDIIAVEFLLNRLKGKVNSTNTSNTSNLYYACASGHTNIVQLLLNNEADPNEVDFFYLETSLHCACMQGHVGIVKHLLKHNADPNSGDIDHRTSLHYACLKKHVEIVEHLLIHKADPNHPDLNDCTSLHYACMVGQEKIVNHLLKTETDVNFQDNAYSRKSLHYSKAENSELVQLLLNNGANPNLQDCHNETSLHYACQHGHVEIVQLLLNYQADHSIPNINKKTSLHYACEHGHTKVIQLLLNYNADPYLRDKFGNNCFDYCDLLRDKFVQIAKNSKSDGYDVTTFDQNIHNIVSDDDKY